MRAGGRRRISDTSGCAAQGPRGSWLDHDKTEGIDVYLGEDTAAIFKDGLARICEEIAFRSEGLGVAGHRFW